MIKNNCHISRSVSNSLRVSYDNHPRPGIEPTAVFLTTHYIEEAERLCDRIAFIVSGRIVQIDTVQNLLQPLKAKHVLQISFENALGEIVMTIKALYAVEPNLGRMLSLNRLIVN